jgi:quinoprotein glucose dehydrogenase
VEEHPVPPSDVPGERAWPTQPFPTRPAPFAKQGFSLDDANDLTPEVRRLARQKLERFRLGPLFTPPSLRGTVAMPGIIGGAGWGGGAFDPETGIFYVKATNQPALLQLARPQPSETVDADFALDFDATADLQPAETLSGGDSVPGVGSLPINKPPYGTLTAIDLSTGLHRWQVVLGDAPAIRNHPLLQGRGLPPLGTPGAPGPIVTRGGLLFVTGGGDTLYALDKATGKVLWQAALGAVGYSVPMTYRTRGGRQLVVVAVGSAGEEGRLLAFGLRE